MYIYVDMVIFLFKKKKCYIKLNKISREKININVNFFRYVKSSKILS